MEKRQFLKPSHVGNVAINALFNFLKVKNIMKNYPINSRFLSKLVIGIVFLCGMMPPPSIAAQPTASETKAKATLDKLKRQFESYKTVEVNFTLTLEFAESKTKEIQSGVMKQEGSKFRVEVKNKKGERTQMVISDGATVWFMPNAREVQISNASKKSGNGIPMPREIIKMYDSGEFKYVVLNEAHNEGGKMCTLIELVPKNAKKSEYTKVQMAVDNKTGDIVYIKAFGRDQSRYTMRLTGLKANSKFAASTFTFNKAEFPNVKVSDLRID